MGSCFASVPLMNHLPLSSSKNWCIRIMRSSTVVDRGLNHDDLLTFESQKGYKKSSGHSL